jgi:hypothetical protein
MTLLEYYTGDYSSYDDKSIKEHFGLKTENDAIQLANEAISVMQTKRKNTSGIYVRGFYGIFDYPEELEPLLVFESYNNPPCF